MTSSHMSSLKKLQNRRIKLNNIVDTAEELFSQKGFETTSVDEITESAGIAKGTFYLYFKSKDQIFEAITARAQDSLLELINKAIKKPLRGQKLLEELFVVYLEFSEKYPMYFEFLNSFYERRHQFKESSFSAQIQTKEDEILTIWENTVLERSKNIRKKSSLIHEVLLTLLARYSHEDSIKTEAKKYNGLIETFYDLIAASI